MKRPLALYGAALTFAALGAFAPVLPLLAAGFALSLWETL